MPGKPIEGIIMKLLKSTELGSDPDILDLEYELSNYIYHKKINDDYVVVSFLTDDIVILDENEFSILMELDGSSDNISLKNHFINKKYWVKDNAVEYENILKNRISFANQSSKFSFTILSSQACNARCSYCFSQQDSSLVMSKETAFKVAEFIKTISEGTNEIHINWFGGEPLLGVDAISIVCNELKQCKELTCSITTNGSLIDETIVERMINEWNICNVIIPLDGNEQVHNRIKNYVKTDKNEYRHIIKTVDILLSKGINVSISLNFDRDNFKYIKEALSDFSIFASNRLFYLKPNAIFPPEKIVNDEKINVITDDYNAYMKDMICWLQEYGYQRTLNSMIPKRFDAACTYADKNNYVVSSSGLLLKCLRKEKVPKNTIGNVTEGISENEESKKALQSVYPPQKCVTCSFFPVCQGGCLLRHELNLQDDIPCNRRVRCMDAVLEYLYAQFNEIENDNG